MDADKSFEKALAALDTLEDRIRMIDCADVRSCVSNQEKPPSLMQVPDVAIAVIAGLLGGLFASNQKTADLFARIHAEASLDSPRSILGKLLNHTGDFIDQYPTPEGMHFVTRDFFRARDRYGASFCHRIFFGHDVFALSQDNPFRVLTAQYGWASGCIQAVRHLFADTFSKAGLPLPFSSYLDYEKDGRLMNYLVTWTQQLTGGNAAEVSEHFGHLFAIRAQDILAQGLAWAICKAYFVLADVRNSIRMSQTRLLAYTIAFFTNFGAGAVLAGVPYINWATLAMLFKEGTGLLILSKNATRELVAITSDLEIQTGFLFEETQASARRVFLTGADLPSYESLDRYFQEEQIHFAQSERVWRQLAEEIERSADGDT